MFSWIYGIGFSFLASKLFGYLTKMNIQVVHALPGRVRLQCSRWKDINVAGALERRVGAHPLVRKVQASPVTGTLLIEFTGTQLAPAQFEGVIKTAAEASADGFKVKEADLLVSMKRVLKKADQTVKAQSLGKVDIRTLIIFYLAWKGIRAFGTNNGEAERQLLWAFRFLNGEGGR